MKFALSFQSVSELNSTFWLERQWKKTVQVICWENSKYKSNLYQGLYENTTARTDLKLMKIGDEIGWEKERKEQVVVLSMGLNTKVMRNARIRGSFIASLSLQKHSKLGNIVRPFCFAICSQLHLLFSLSTKLVYLSSLKWTSYATDPFRTYLWSGRTRVYVLSSLYFFNTIC